MAVSKRPSLRDNLTTQGEAAEAVAAVRELQRRQHTPDTQGERAMTTSTFHLPADLLFSLQQAAVRRADRKRRESPNGRGGRPSVSEIVVELLEEQRERIEKLD